MHLATELQKLCPRGKGFQREKLIPKQRGPREKLARLGMKCFLQAHGLQHVHVALNLPCFPANVCEFPLCVEPLELENNPPPCWEAKGPEPHAALLNRTPSLRASPQRGTGAAHKAEQVLGKKMKHAWCLWMYRKEYILLGAWREGKNPQNIDNLEENRFWVFRGKSEYHYPVFPKVVILQEEHLH